jgi:hypothetical protein
MLKFMYKYKGKNMTEPSSPESLPREVRQNADAATIYQNSVHWMLKSGVQPEVLSQITNRANTLFPDETQRHAAISFTQELEGYIQKYGQQLDPNHIRGLLQDTARQDFETAARIVRTLTPDEVWREKVEPELARNKIQESPQKLW